MLILTLVLSNRLFVFSYLISFVVFITQRKLSVGPAPPVLQLSSRWSAQTNRADESSHEDTNKWVRMQYREHNLRLARSLGRNTSTSTFGSSQLASQSRQTAARSSSLCRDLVDCCQDDLYKEFDQIYTSLCSERRPKASQVRVTAPPTTSVWAPEAAYETRALRESLLGVENALRGSKQMTTTSNHTIEDASLGNPPSPTTSATTNTTNRADSRNTNQSIRELGPALVEEMTLSDLEDEICSTLMAAKEAKFSRSLQLPGADLLASRGPRNRQPLPSVVGTRGPAWSPTVVRPRS